MSAVTITAGKTWGSNDPVSVANLNLAANPTAEIPPSSITSAELNIPEVSAQLVTNSARNLFRNAGLSKRAIAHALTSGQHCATSAMGWFFRHTGTAAVTVATSTAEIIDDKASTAIVFTGASGTSTDGTVIGQSFGPRDALDIRGGYLTFSFYVKNQTGASVDASILIYTWDAADTAAASTLAVTSDATAVPVSANWVRIDATVDASLWSGGAALNGFDVYLKTNAAMTNGSYTLSYAMPQMELGEAVTSWEPSLFRPEYRTHYHASTEPTASYGVRQGYAQGDRWRVGNTSVWELLDSTNAAAIWCKVASKTGSVTQQILTSGTNATFTPSNGVRAMRAQVWGAGGGGGGSNGTASNIGYGMSGGGGGYSEVLVTDMAQVFKYTIGAGGSGGASGSNAGTAGGDSTFFGGVAGATALAVGGGGGGGAAGVAGTSNSLTGRGGTAGAGSVGSLNLNGSPGGPSGRLSGTSNLLPSLQGVAPFIGCAAASNENADGYAAQNKGTGGGGAYVTSAASRAGGLGGDGLIIVTEFY